jgi:hypothetical protein
MRRRGRFDVGRVLDLSTPPTRTCTGWARRGVERAGAEDTWRT